MKITLDLIFFFFFNLRPGQVNDYWQTTKGGVESFPTSFCHLKGQNQNLHTHTRNPLVAMRHLVIVLPRGRAWDPNFQFGGRPMVASSLERRVWLQPRETFALPDSLAPEQCSARGRLGSLRASGVPQAPRGAATLRPLQALDSLAAELLFPPPMARAPPARSPRARMANRSVFHCTGGWNRTTMRFPFCS
ncbi:Hypothetical predicted protein [Marmota monax]|uniref:Secreted protein n=1 Tax=Marmota monax TaxID=9995 RepID=A0A5E4C0U8_MARMO|nr:Hypothetical predicted protein [Marmota monax]